MTWSSKVAWTEGLFLRPQHFQQADRYHEQLLQRRVARVTPYPWGITALEIDHDLAQQGSFAVRRCSGVMPDGLPFDFPDVSPPPEPLELDPKLSNAVVGLAIPALTEGGVDVDFEESESASRYVRASEPVVDSASQIRVQEEIDIAHPRLSYRLFDGQKSGFIGIGLARILEVQDKTPVFDTRYLPPALSTHAHAGFNGMIDRAIGWIETRLTELARYAADPSAGGGLQFGDYFMLQVLNRELPVLRHLRQSQYVHPERLYEHLLRLVGELATVSSSRRMAPPYPAYDHDNLADTFHPVLRDLQNALSARMERRAIRLELIERAANAYVSPIRDRGLFQHATFVIEVSSARPLTEIQTAFPQLFKIGPSTRMQDIVQAHMPGIPLVHTPTPPRQIRSISDHVYFRLDRTSQLWPEFSNAPAVGMHFSGDWPDLKLEFWAVREDVR